MMRKQKRWEKRKGMARVGGRKEGGRKWKCGEKIIIIIELLTMHFDSYACLYGLRYVCIWCLTCVNGMKVKSRQSRYHKLIVHDIWKTARFICCIDQCFSFPPPNVRFRFSCKTKTTTINFSLFACNYYYNKWGFNMTWTFVYTFIHSFILD